MQRLVKRKHLSTKPIQTILAMKKLLLLSCFLVGSMLVNAQGTIDAKQVFNQINSGQKAAYVEATISGDLDLTELSTKRIKEKNSRWGGQNAYESKVKVPLIFKNCRFTGSVIAFKLMSKDGSNRRILGIEIEGSNHDVYTADFEDEVIFDNCVFEGETQFKYSDFARTVRFTGCRFKKNANFKYAEAQNDAVFSNTVFEEYADFKYAYFKSSADFQKTTFNNYSDFKYTKFNEVSNFDYTTFKGYADFKYTNFRQHANFNHTSFTGRSDFKYARGR